MIPCNPASSSWQEALTPHLATLYRYFWRCLSHFRDNDELAHEAVLHFLVYFRSAWRRRVAAVSTAYAIQYVLNGDRVGVGSQYTHGLVCIQAGARRRRELTAARRTWIEQTPTGQPEPPAAEDPAHGATHAELRGRVAAALCHLPERQRTVLTLCFGLQGGTGLPLADIAGRLGCTKQAVHKTERKALTHLRKSPCRELLAPFVE